MSSSSAIASSERRTVVTAEPTPRNGHRGGGGEVHTRGFPYRDLFQDGTRKLPKSTLAVGISQCMLTLSPIPDVSLRVSDAVKFVEVAESLIQKRFKETSWPSDTKFEIAWLGGVESFLVFGEEAFLTVGAGIVMFTAKSEDDLPQETEVKSIVENELTNSLAQALQDTGDYSYIEEVSLKFITEPPSSTVAPTQATTKVPTQMPTLSPTETPTSPPTPLPTTIPTEAPTRSPTVAPTQHPTQPPTAVPTLTPPTVSPTPLVEGIAPPVPDSGSSPQVPDRQVKPAGGGGGSSVGVPAVVGSVTVAFAFVLLVIVIVVWRRRASRAQWRESVDNAYPDDDTSKANVNKRGLADASSDAGSSSRFGRIVAALDAVVLPLGGSPPSDMDQGNTSSEDDTEDFPPDFENVEVVEPIIVPIDDVQTYQIHQNAILGEEMEGFEGWGDALPNPHPDDIMGELSLDHSLNPGEREFTIV